MRKAEINIRQENPTFFTLGLLDIFLDFKDEAVRSSETSVDFHRPTQHCMPEDRTTAVRTS
jgi:hypothetical protein